MQVEPLTPSLAHNQLATFTLLLSLFATFIIWRGDEKNESIESRVSLSHYRYRLIWLDCQDDTR